MYRTKTYIAADWDNDKVAVEQLYKWKIGNGWSLKFCDAHEFTQARDSSLPCSIKASLKKRMDVSKKFILIVGDHTNTVTKGSCHLCKSYNSYIKYCARRYAVDNRSFIKYECDKAIEAKIKIVVLYHATSVDKNKCPSSLRNVGVHVPMVCKRKDGRLYWDYNTVKRALEA